jgi:2,3-bisphosphoglycerate-independent phosphoglycerate mutase
MNGYISKPIVLIVMDGVGIAQAGPGNAVTKAKTPFLEQAWDSYPHTQLLASGEAVGLPIGVKGNSEVGHMNLGTGKIMYQDLPRINNAIVRGGFFHNEEFVNAFKHVEANKGRLHIGVIFSDAGVHGTINHLEAFLETIHQNNFKEKLIIHAFTDGRDSPPKSAPTFLTIVDQEITRAGIGTIGSVMGRYYAMDRNQMWDRVAKAYHALVSGEGYTAGTWREAVDQAYARGETDEFICPTLIKSGTLQEPQIKTGDAFILLNYRSDRAIELTSALTQEMFPFFKRGPLPAKFYFVGMTQYAKGVPQHVAFPPESPSLTLGRILSEHDHRQLRIAESEKFPHVTYFFNGGTSIRYKGEDHMEIPSPNVATYDQKPEMSLPELTETLLTNLSLRIYDFVLVNFANGDMVGHTGIFEAGVRAMTTVDTAVSQIVSAVQSLGGTTLITADHGNVEEMVNMHTGSVDTEHSDNPVPFILIPPSHVDITTYKLEAGKLSDIAPTILKLFGMRPPDEMKGRSLF